MLRRPHVEPFTRESDGAIEVDFLRDTDGRTVAFLDRLLRLLRRLEGRPRRVVSEALRRQERRVRDARRLAGISRTLLDLCEFRPPEGAETAPRMRDAVFTARGQLWPPLPGDLRAPYEAAAEMIAAAASAASASAAPDAESATPEGGQWSLGAGLGAEPPFTADDIERLLYADAPDARILVRAPALDGPALLARYNLDLARGVLLDAESVTLTAGGGWRGIFRAVKLARLMYRIERTGRSYRVELTGPAAAFVTRAQRYGIRFARVVPALIRAPRWRLDATIVRGSRRMTYSLDGNSPLPAPRKRRRYDSMFERSLAREFAARMKDERKGWTLTREDAPVAVGGQVFLPDFTLRHRDGREALVEIVGFWTPEYLERKLEKVRAAALDNLVLVVYRGLAAGVADAGGLDVTGAAVVWFAEKPRIGPVLDAVERMANVPAPTRPTRRRRGRSPG